MPAMGRRGRAGRKKTPANADGAKRGKGGRHARKAAPPEWIRSVLTAVVAVPLLRLFVLPTRH